MIEPQEINWNQLESEIVSKLRFLKAVVQMQGSSALIKMVMNEIILPELGLLAKFCEALQIGEEAAKKLEGLTNAKTDPSPVANPDGPA